MDLDISKTENRPHPTNVFIAVLINLTLATRLIWLFTVLPTFPKIGKTYFFKIRSSFQNREIYNVKHENIPTIFRKKLAKLSIVSLTREVE